jgi:hypothetical protein
VEFAAKLAVVLLDDLAVWQKTTVTASLVSGMAATDPSTVGEPYIDGSGNRYLPMLRAIELAIFTRELFSTPHDVANRAAVAAVPGDRLDLVGIAMRPDRKLVDKVLDKLRPQE